jgi:hypothetical protein
MGRWPGAGSSGLTGGRRGAGCAAPRRRREPGPGGGAAAGRSPWRRPAPRLSRTTAAALRPGGR